MTHMATARSSGQPIGGPILGTRLPILRHLGLNLSEERRGPIEESMCVAVPRLRRGLGDEDAARQTLTRLRIVPGLAGGISPQISNPPQAGPLPRLVRYYARSEPG